MKSTPFVGVDATKICEETPKKCDGFTLSGHYTVMTSAEGVNSLTVDAMLMWGKTAPEDPEAGLAKGEKLITRDFNKDMEIGWNIENADAEYSMEQVSQKYWASGWPSSSHKPKVSDAQKKKPSSGDYKWIFENRQYACTIPYAENKCKYNPKKNTSFNSLWQVNFADHNEKMQRVVATRLFTPEGEVPAAFKWKLDSDKKWTVWFNAVGKGKSYSAESAVMTLKLSDGGPVLMFWNLAGLITNLGAIIIAALILVIIMAAIILSCIFCKCCKKCACCAKLKEKCKRKPKEQVAEPEEEIVVEDFYAAKPRRSSTVGGGAGGAAGNASLGGSGGRASPPGSPGRQGSPSGRSRSFRNRR